MKGGGLSAWGGLGGDDAPVVDSVLAGVEAHAHLQLLLLSLLQA